MSSSLRLPSYRVFPVESPHDINGEFQRFFCPSQVDLLGHFQFTLYTADREALGQYVVRGAIGTKKIHYDEASDTVVWTASPKGFYKGTSETFKGFEFVDQLVAHLPPRRVQLVRRYGAYFGKVHNQWQQRPGIYHLAPEAWRHAHQLRTQSTPETKPATVDSAEVPDAWSTLRKQSWARLLQKVYEVDPFVCAKCQGSMSVVAIIEDPKELGKIIDWAQQQEREQQLTVCARSPPEPVLMSVYYPKNGVNTE